MMIKFEDSGQQRYCCKSLSTRYRRGQGDIRGRRISKVLVLVGLETISGHHLKRESHQKYQVWFMLPQYINTKELHDRRWLNNCWRNWIPADKGNMKEITERLTHKKREREHREMQIAETFKQLNFCYLKTYQLDQVVSNPHSRLIACLHFFSIDWIQAKIWGWNIKYLAT